MPIDHGLVTPPSLFSLRPFSGHERLVVRALCPHEAVKTEVCGHRAPLRPPASPYLCSCILEPPTPRPGIAHHLTPRPELGPGAVAPCRGHRSLGRPVVPASSHCPQVFWHKVDDVPGCGHLCPLRFHQLLGALLHTCALRCGPGHGHRASLGLHGQLHHQVSLVGVRAGGWRPG